MPGTDNCEIGCYCCQNIGRIQMLARRGRQVGGEVERRESTCSLFSAGRNAQNAADSCRAGEASAGAGTSRTNRTWTKAGRKLRGWRGKSKRHESYEWRCGRTRETADSRERESKEAQAPRPLLRGRRKSPEEEAGGGFEAARWHLARAAREKGDCRIGHGAHVEVKWQDKKKE